MLLLLGFEKTELNHIHKTEDAPTLRHVQRAACCYVLSFDLFSVPTDIFVVFVAHTPSLELHSLVSSEHTLTSHVSPALCRLHQTRQAETHL